MSPKPLALAVASVLVGVIGMAMAIVGVILVAIAAGTVAFIEPHGTTGVIAGLLGAVGVAVGAAGVGSAVALWLGRAWGWAGSMAIAVTGSLGAAVAIESSGPQAPVLAGAALAVVAVILLVAPRTREAAGLA